METKNNSALSAFADKKLTKEEVMENFKVEQLEERLEMGVWGNCVPSYGPSYPCHYGASGGTVCGPSSYYYC